MKKKLVFTCLLVFTLLVTKVYFHQGFPFTHDGENHLARFANYKVAAREGQIPPRFAPNLVNHYGYPVFNYNYPLANILSLPFSFLKINYEFTFKVLSTSFIFFGMFGVFSWLKELEFSDKTSLVATATYAVTPYLTNTVVFRGNIGEVISMSLIAWLLYFVEKVRQNKLDLKKYFFYIAVVIMTAFLLAHNIFALFGMGLFFIYALVRLGLDRDKWRQILSVFGLSLLLVAWFWLPAMMEKSFVILDTASLSSNFADHFPIFEQLFFSPAVFGFSRLGSVDSLGFGLGIAQILFLVIASVVLFINFTKVNKEKRYLVLFFIILCVSLVIFQLSFSTIIWKALPFVNFIQFPWRLSAFFAVLITPIVAFSFQQVSRSWRVLLMVILLMQVVSLSRVKAVDYFHKTNVDYDAFSQSTTTLNENTPKTFTYKDVGDWQPGPSLLSGKGDILVKKWSGSKRTYELNLSEPSTIVEPTMNFAGWQTKVVNKNKEGKKAEKISYFDDNQVKGRIAYKLDTGTYSVRSKFTQRTKPRLIGNVLSSLGILLLVFMFTRKKILRS